MENETPTDTIGTDIERATTPARLSETHGLANAYIHLATSDNTRKAYRSDVRHFEAWGGRLPATPTMIASYLEAHATILNPRTLARRLIALRHWHVYRGDADPTLHPGVQKTMAGSLVSRARCRAQLP